MSIDQERVLVVPTELLHRLGHFQGFTSDVDRYLAELLNPEHASYRPRAQMEQDPSFKQLIPYVIFQHRDSAGAVRLFHYTRGSGQGERRLHRKRSIGVGGHISIEDSQVGGPPYEEGMRRELSEEVDVASPYRQRLVGLINDDETDVGRVHLGLVHVFELESPAVEPREDDIAETGFAPVETLLADRERFESWSQICLEAFLW
ncbi:MAG: phosphoesterase [Planctomycetes bacterium]|nr:phosphoesterase [Planctomycetota bacterium]